MNGNSMNNGCCPIEVKDTIRGLMKESIAESRNLRSSISEIHDIMLGAPVDERSINANEPESLESAISIVLNTIKVCNDIANHVLTKL